MPKNILPSWTGREIKSLNVIDRAKIKTMFEFCSWYVQNSMSNGGRDGSTLPAAWCLRDLAADR